MCAFLAFGTDSDEWLGGSFLPGTELLVSNIYECRWASGFVEKNITYF
jgi:hypothetical protein